MSQVLFAGNLAAYGTLTPAFLTSIAANGIEPFVLTRFGEVQSDLFASKFDTVSQRLLGPNKLSDINPSIIHAFFGRQMPELDTMSHVEHLVRRFEGAKFLVGIDSVQTDQLALHSALLGADAITVPHASIVDAFTAGRMTTLAELIRDVEKSGRLFEVRPGIDTKKFNPYEDRALDDNYYSDSSPYDIKGRFNFHSPAVKKFLLSTFSRKYDLLHTRDSFSMLYGPDISIPGNLSQLISSDYFGENTPKGGINTFFVGSDPIPPPYLDGLKERVVQYRKKNTVVYVHLDDESEYRRMLAGTYMGIFPPELGEFGFASVPYVQRAFEAMRYGVMLAVAPAFQRQGIVRPHKNRLPGTPYEGIAFPAEDDSPKAMSDAKGCMYREAFEYINGNYRFSGAVVGAMRVRCSLEETVKSYLDIYKMLFS